MTLSVETLAEAVWQPIETAPKDGTRILVGRAGDMVGPDEIEITYWYEMEQWHWEHVADDLYRKVQDDPRRSWNNNGGRATHWMPLPAAPKIQHSEGE